MEKFSKNIDGIRNMLKNLKAEKYAIVNPELVALDEYVKGLYLKVLCTVIQYENDPSEMQILYLKRIVNGISIDDTVEECMRKALEISLEDMQEFLSIIGKMNCKYYFAVDGIILSSLGKKNTTGYDYFAEILELLEINKADLEYICTIAKSVLQQNSAFYNQAKELVNERVEKLDFTPYIQNFYAGAVIDNMELVHYTAPNKKMSEGIIYDSEYTAKKVLFDNLLISMQNMWEFDSCEMVVFRNCVVIGKDTTIQFMACKHIIFENCKFISFKQAVFEINEVEIFSITNCEFEECYAEYRCYRNAYCSTSKQWTTLGGVIHTNNANRTTTVLIKKSSFKNCGGKNREDACRSAVISNCKCKVENSSFYNCWNYHTYHGNFRIDQEDNRRTLFIEETEGVNNEIVGSAIFC